MSTTSNFMKTAVLAVAFAVIGAGFPMRGYCAPADDVAMLKEQVSQLQAKVLDLENRLALKHDPVSNQPAIGDPFGQMQEIDAMEKQMMAMIGQPFMGMGPAVHGMVRGHASSFYPDYDIKATDKEYQMSFDMPGMDKSKINVEVKNGALLVSGERSTESKEDQGGKVYRQQRSFGYFSRVIPLPEDAMPETMQAKYDNGVLRVTVAKKEVVKSVPVKQKIEVK